MTRRGGRGGGGTEEQKGCKCVQWGGEAGKESSINELKSHIP